MKKQKTYIPSFPNQVKYNRYNEKEELNTENLVGVDIDEVEKKLKEIECKIESIGSICDKKKQKSYDELSAIYKREKGKVLDDVNVLNEMLNDTIKQNTRDHYLNKLKKEVAVMKQQIHDQDKLLTGIINIIKRIIMNYIS
jgi:tRNA C32,U32 (ribose-2'-O)-methylase TrmJ